MLFTFHTFIYCGQWFQVQMKQKKKPHPDWPPGPRAMPARQPASSCYFSKSHSHTSHKTSTTKSVAVTCNEDPVAPFIRSVQCPRDHLNSELLLAWVRCLGDVSTWLYQRAPSPLSPGSRPLPAVTPRSPATSRGFCAQPRLFTWCLFGVFVEDRLCLEVMAPLNTQTRTDSSSTKKHTSVSWCMRWMRLTEATQPPGVTHRPLGLTHSPHRAFPGDIQVAPPSSSLISPGRVTIWTGLKKIPGLLPSVTKVSLKGNAGIQNYQQ